jgi:hypothetical protein
MDEQEVRKLSNEALVQYYENAVTKNATPVPRQVSGPLRNLGPEQALLFKNEILRRLNEGKKRGY